MKYEEGVGHQEQQSTLSKERLQLPVLRPNHLSIMAFDGVLTGGSISIGDSGGSFRILMTPPHLLFIV